MSNDGWELVTTQLASLIAGRTAPRWCSSTRGAWPNGSPATWASGWARQLVAAHHGSLAKEQRLDAEQRLKRGELSVLVATASLELGIDIGDVDLVCQIGSPRSIAAFLQRAGRSGHAVSGTPKARLFPTTRDELVECTALLDCVRRGELDTLVIPPQPLDVLAQQIVAEVACREWDEDGLYALVRGAGPYRDAVARRFRRRGAHAGGGLQHPPRPARGLPAPRRRARPAARAARRPTHRDHLRRRHSRHRRLRGGAGAAGARSSARSTRTSRSRAWPATSSSSATPATASCGWSAAGCGWKTPTACRRTSRSGWARRPGAATHCRWACRACARTIAAQLDAGGGEAATGLAARRVGLREAAAQQLVDYLAARAAALGVLPTQSTLVFERFFDESGGTQLVIHTPFGSRINRAWGLALRKRFCRQFNFELQAAATEDAIVLSLSTSHSFPLEEVARYLHSASADHVLTQALLDAPLFGARWRWNAVTALALPRFRGGKKSPPQLQRMRSEDLLATVFPDQVACLENIVGEREIPDHPLVAQTLHDCLREAMDVDGLLRVLRGLEAGDITRRRARPHRPQPAGQRSAHRRAVRVPRRRATGRTPHPGRRPLATRPGRRRPRPLDPAAIEAVRGEAWPQVRSADEMHEALEALGAISDAKSRGTTGPDGSMHWKRPAERPARCSWA